MDIANFDENYFKKHYRGIETESKYGSGQLVIVAGSKLFHGAAVLALEGASRLVGMCYFSGPDDDKETYAKVRASLSSFIWVDREELSSYVAKSEVVLLGPGLVRSHVRENGFVCDEKGEETRKLCLSLIETFPEKKWVIDGGALQVLRAEELPSRCVVTPNKKEFGMLFGEEMIEEVEGRSEQIARLALKIGGVILTKGRVGMVSDGREVMKIEGGSEGLVKGGVGDLMAGLTAGLLMSNEPLFAAAGATLLVKRAGEELEQERGMMFNSDDLAEKVPLIFGRLCK